MLTAVYLLITISPIASIGSRSTHFFQALAKECSGDCRLCGCSTERSASHACCCWQKKMAATKNLQQPVKPQPCQTVPAIAAGNCCSKTILHPDQDNETPLTAQDSAAYVDTQVASIGICPCGSDKDLPFSSEERAQHIPIRYLSREPIQTLTPFVFLQPERLATRSDQPPDPPPKIHILS